MLKIPIQTFIVLFLLLILSGCLQQTKSDTSDATDTSDDQTSITEEFCGDSIVGEKETCSNCPVDVKCKSNENCISNKCLPKETIPEEKDLTYKCPEVCASNEFCNSNGECEPVELENTNYCGNFICEPGESYEGNVLAMDNIGKECYFDCSAPCSSEYCNEFVEIDCGCSEYEALADRHGCINNAEPCTDCGIQETLFPELLEIQTDIYTCLVDYFKFKPNKLIYKVFNNPNLEICTEPEGCIGIEGGAGGPDYVMFHNLDGFRSYGEVVPTEPEYLQADVHETTHYFLYQVLHGIPSWFHEVVAIQTNERLKCSEKQAEWGDSYLREDGNGGILMDDGTTLDLDFYKRLKEGETSLSEEEKKDHYITAVLFILGLKEDYNCGFYCIRDIVLKLHEYELKQCSADANACAVQETMNGQFITMWLGGSEESANNKIKEVTSEIVGEDVTSLFTLLQIGEYEPLPSACGPTSDCVLQ